MAKILHEWDPEYRKMVFDLEVASETKQRELIERGEEAVRSQADDATLKAICDELEAFKLFDSCEDWGLKAIIDEAKARGYDGIEFCEDNGVATMFAEVR